MSTLVGMPTIVDAPGGAERRHSPRTPEDAACTVDGTEAQLLNLSTDGARLRLEEPPDGASPGRGQEVTVEAEPIGQRQARVVWRRDRDLGVVFARAA